MDSFHVHFCDPSVVGHNAVGFVLDVGNLGINQRAYATINNRKDFVFVKGNELILESLLAIDRGVAVVVLAVEVTLDSVGVAAELADNDGALCNLAELNLLEVNVAGVDVAL